MVTGEESIRSRLNADSEIISLFAQPSCQKPPIFPIENSIALYGILSGEVPLLCGFSEKETGCFKFKSVENNWVNIHFSLLENRSHASSIKYGNGSWIISGGQKYHGRVPVLLDTSEILRDSEFAFGPNLPMPLSGHCSLKIKEDQIFITGGYGEPHLKDSFIMNINYNTLDNLPFMKFGRFGHACGRTMTLFSEIEIVIAGGLYQNIIEIYSFVHSKWFTLPNIEDHPIFKSAIVQGETTFVITGGVELEPHCATINCRQDTIKLYDIYFKALLKNEKKLSQGRGNHLATALPIDVCYLGKT